MKKIITIVSIVGALMLILDSVNASHALLLWVFAGIIPGTDILLSPAAFMVINSIVIGIIILRMTVWQHIQLAFAVRDETVAPAKKQTPALRRTA